MAAHLILKQNPYMYLYIGVDGFHPRKKLRVDVLQRRENSPRTVALLKTLTSDLSDGFKADI